MNAQSRMRLIAAVVAAACAVELTGCTTVGKSGAPDAATTVLHLGAADVNNAQLATFVAEIDARSHHRLRVQVDRRTYFSETPGGELKLAGALAAGKVDLGYLPSRDWEQAGATGFAALQAPGLITTTAQEIRLAHDPLATSLLGGLAAKGVHGLALIPDEARRLITRHPVLAAADLGGEEIRIGDNARSAAMITTIGATPIQGITAAQTKARLEHGTLDGVETGPTPASENSYNVPAPYLTSFALIPKFEVLAANGAFWKRLSPAVQRLLQDAATATVTHAGTDVPKREAAQLQLLCQGGAVVVRPTVAGLQDILAAAERSRPTDAADTALMTRISAAIGAAAPEPDAAPLPSACRTASTAAAAVKLHGGATTALTVTPQTNPAMLVGTYRLDVTEEDWVAGGVVGADWNTAITFTYHLYANGRLTETQSPDFPDQGPLAGTWRVHGKQITFVSGSPGGAENDFDETVSWSFFNGVLSLKPLVVQDQPGRVIYSVPWHKTA